MILRAQGVGWDVGSRRILDDVDLAVAPGEVVGLIGPNGSGKSSLLRLLAGLGKPSRGSVRLDETNIEKLPRRRVAQRVAFVEQAAVTDQNPRVVDVLALGRTPHRRTWAVGSAWDRQIVQTVARETEIDGMLDERYGSLSGGERQRVQIARAFVQEPEVMILDEPTNHLDIKYQLSLLELVSTHVRSTDASAIIAVHDLNLAAMFCDRIIVLAGGRVVGEGTPGDTITEKVIGEVFDVRARIVDDDGVWVRVGRADYA
ncbi:ABC transporter ATP-binding protein [Gordonia liuliyuniae]|uniref:ABC transporter ATP-binding protein n=1 Tax=Gordonia liuliyuniae TaxID=2911517 RepID=A0ABS9IV44_9ACTN|nr:ABC transporter ATP-binding protein [Gordonia liuliyuniae]MCF8589431.1 ABC transporter ATP-binding protein [Gordonia liuliyuniae]